MVISQKSGIYSGSLASVYSPNHVESADAPNSDTQGQLYYAILYKGLVWIFEHEQILVWWGALESIPSLDTEGRL